MDFPNLEAVLFDWDGVVIDSSSLHKKSWELLAEERGLFLPEDHFKKGFGKKNQVIIPTLGWSDEPGKIEELGNRKEELYRELVHEHGLRPLPGVKELIEELRREKIPCSVGSSTPKANIEFILHEIGLEGMFDALTCAEDVSHGKPDPEVFLLAAQKVSATPSRCVVIEDALFGVEAAHAAGMKCLAVATTNPLEKLHSADRAVASLEEISVADLRALL